MDARTGTAGTIFSRVQDFAQGSVSYGLVTRFETSGPVTNAPEPASLGLLALALLAIALLRGWSKRSFRRRPLGQGSIAAGILVLIVSLELVHK
jgi:hypothetical protein